MLLLLLLCCASGCWLLWLSCELCQVCDGRADVDDVEGGTILTHHSINLLPGCALLDAAGDQVLQRHTSPSLLTPAAALLVLAIAAQCTRSVCVLLLLLRRRRLLEMRGRQMMLLMLLLRRQHMRCAVARQRRRVLLLLPMLQVLLQVVVLGLVLQWLHRVLLALRGGCAWRRQQHHLRRGRHAPRCPCVPSCCVLPSDAPGCCAGCFGASCTTITTGLLWCLVLAMSAPCQ